MNAYTTIEESKQLIEAGLNVNTADGYLQHRWKEVTQNHCFQAEYGKKISCWSLAALLDLIPDGIHWYLDENGLTIAEVDYYKDGKEVYVFRELYRNPVDAIIWLLEHNYIKNVTNN